MRSDKIVKTAAFAALFLVLACSALPKKDLRDEYFEVVRELGLTPVYPPREELQVGDVFLVSTEPASPNDPEKTVSVWMGTLDTIRDEANRYLNSRINFENTNTTAKFLGATRWQRNGKTKES